MSRKNKPMEKKIRTLHRALRKGRLPAYIDLVEWLKDRKYVDTVGDAYHLIKEERVRSESHPLGLTAAEVDGKMVNVVERYVSGSLRSTIHVVDADVA
jgi:hypothetical protein